MSKGPPPAITPLCFPGAGFLILMDLIVRKLVESFSESRKGLYDNPEPGVLGTVGIGYNEYPSGDVPLLP